MTADVLTPAEAAPDPAADTPFYAGPIRSVWRLFGPRRSVLTAAVTFRFAQALFQAVPVVALVWVIDLVRRDALNGATAWAAAGLVLAGAVGQYLAGLCLQPAGLDRHLPRHR